MTGGKYLVVIAANDAMFVLLIKSCRSLNFDVDGNVNAQMKLVKTEKEDGFVMKK